MTKDGAASRFVDLAKRLVNVPKEEIDRERSKDEQSRSARKRRPRKASTRNRA